MTAQPKRTFYEVGDALDFDKPSPKTPDVEFRGQSHEVAPPASIQRVLVLTGKEAPAPESPAVAALRALEVDEAAELNESEAAEVSQATAKLVETWQDANTELLVAEQAWLDAKARWAVKLLGAYEEFQPTQNLLSERITAYKVAAKQAIEERARNEREAAEAAEAAREKELDARYGQRRWIVMRRRPANGPYAQREDLPYAKKADDIAPMIHTAECGATKELQRPMRRDHPKLVDWNAEPAQALRAGAQAERLPEVLKALAEGAPPCYQSAGKVWINTNSAGPRRPSRLCRRCNPLPTIREALGEEKWKEWQEEHGIHYPAPAWR